MNVILSFAREVGVHNGVRIDDRHGGCYLPIPLRARFGPSLLGPGVPDLERPSRSPHCFSPRRVLPILPVYSVTHQPGCSELARTVATHLESLIFEYLDWQGYLVRRNIKVGRLPHGGYEMELDLVGYNHKSGDLVHYEPSIDALCWAKREERYRKKFGAGQKYIFEVVFPWLESNTPLRQIAIFINHPRDRDAIAGGTIDELMAEIRGKVAACGIMAKGAIPEQYPLLRTLQLSHVGYYRAL